jgi:diguanylate cyclase
MNKLPSITAVTMATCVAAAGAVLWAWPDLRSMLLDAVHSGPTLSSTWESIEVDASGRIIKTVYNPFAVASTLSLTLLGFVAVGLGAVQMAVLSEKLGRQRAPANAEQVAATGAQLEHELAAILVLIKSYLQSNNRFADTLSKVQESLPSLARPEQVRVAVQLLIAETEKAQRDANELKSNLEQSKTQVEALRSNLDEAHELGLRDSLTEVGNRRCFDLALAREVAHAQAQKSAMCLVIGDIDHFKRVNDAYGHLVGDEVLKKFARLLLDNVKGRDTVARYGGEEFAIILPETNIDSATSLADRIRLEFESKKLALKGGQKLGTLTASFGVAEINDGDDPELLFQRADAKLYEAKCAGRNRVATFGRL